MPRAEQMTQHVAHPTPPWLHVNSLHSSISIPLRRTPNPTLQSHHLCDPLPSRFRPLPPLSPQLRASSLHPLMPALALLTSSSLHPPDHAFSQADPPPPLSARRCLALSCAHRHTDTQT
eukprot:3399363-Rhodomonas_salina.4